MSVLPDEGRQRVRWLRWIIGAAIVVGAVGIIVWLSVPSLQIDLVRAPMTEKLANARGFVQSAQMLALDEQNASDGKSGGWPADLSIKTAREYIDRLVKDGYLTESERHKYRLDDFVVVNVAENDPPQTAFLLSKSYFDVKYRYPEVKGWKFIVFRKGGGGGLYTRSSDRWSGAVVLPSRNPQFLLNE